MLELQKLHYFVTVAETLNVGQAAQQLHISQSPLSRQIISLEDRLGVSLFSRERKRLKLTEAGRRFLDEAKTLLCHAQRLEDNVRDEATGKAGTLTLGFVEGAIHIGTLQTAIKRFLKVLPHARVELKNLRSKQQFEALQLGAIDVGFAYSAPPCNTSLIAELIADENFALAMPNTHPLSHGRLDLRKLDGEPFIALPEKDSPGSRQTLLSACANAGFTPDIQLEASDPSVVLELVDAGIGLAIVQESVNRAGTQNIVLRPLPESFSLRAQIFRVTRSDVRPLVSRFLDSQHT
jgi:DNA-binding transcriptional LysR family regulator